MAIYFFKVLETRSPRSSLVPDASSLPGMQAATFWLCPPQPGDRVLVSLLLLMQRHQLHGLRVLSYDLTYPFYLLTDPTSKYSHHGDEGFNIGIFQEYSASQNMLSKAFKWFVIPDCHTILLMNNDNKPQSFPPSSGFQSVPVEQAVLGGCRPQTDSRDQPSGNFPAFPC